MHATVKDILRVKGGHVYTVQPRTSALEAVHVMNAHSVGCVVVVEGRELVGILGESDIVRHLVAKGRNATGTLVVDIMSPPVATVSPDTSVRTAMHIVTTARCRHVPVVGPDGLSGLISAGDVLAWNLRELRAELADMERYIHGPLSLSSRPPAALP